MTWKSLFVKIDSNESYLIGDNQTLGLIWENQFQKGILSDIINSVGVSHGYTDHHQGRGQQ